MTVVAADRFDLSSELIVRAFYRDDDIGNVLVVYPTVVIVVGEIDDDRRRMCFAADQGLEFPCRHQRDRCDCRGCSEYANLREADGEAISRIARGQGVADPADASGARHGHRKEAWTDAAI